MTTTASFDAVAQLQLSSLDDTDCYASVWSDILTRQKQQQSSTASSSNLWGGRGKGGRGLNRRTVQPNDVILQDVRLQYLQQQHHKDACLLEGAELKLLHGRIYALIGRNGCGKTTLLRRMHAQKIPGWSTQWSSLLIPSELPSALLQRSPVDVVLSFLKEVQEQSQEAVQSRIVSLEKQLESLEIAEDEEQVEQLCNTISALEEELEDGQSSRIRHEAHQHLIDFGFSDHEITTCTCGDLSLGQQKLVLLSIMRMRCLLPTLILLDEPTNNLDVMGMIRLRHMIEECAKTTTFVIISHDVDLINDVATDIIDIHNQKLWYFPGNYDSYRLMKDQQGLHELRKDIALEKKRDQLQSTLQNLREQPIPKRGGANRKAKIINSHKRKMDRHKVAERRSGAPSTPLVTVNNQSKLTAAQKLRLFELMKSTPHKSIQFNFPKVDSVWGEPLITLLEVGHGQEGSLTSESTSIEVAEDEKDNDLLTIQKKAGFLFDSVDLCVPEGSRTCILGPVSAGKSTLLRLIAKRMNPREGNVHHASGIRVGYYDGQAWEDMHSPENHQSTALLYLSEKFPMKTEQEIRSHLAGFGLSPTIQSKTPIRFLSGGEKNRLTMAAIMMERPPVLCLDDPTAHLDVESVQALAYGLSLWTGTLVVVSQDASFLRSLSDVHCFVLVPEEGKLRRVEGGMDDYLRSFKP